MSVLPIEAPARPVERAKPTGMGRILDREAPLAYLLMFPGLFILALFMAYPFGLGVYLSMTDKYVGFANYDFIGFDNFRYLFQDTIFQRTVRNTFVYSFFTVPFKLVLGMGLALVLNNHFHFSRFMRAGLLLPWIVPTAISSLAWLMLYDSVLSPFSILFKNWGLIDSNINFLGSQYNAMAALCLANVWRGVPFFAVSILAGLQAVPPDLHEAAALDGASAWRRFRDVTLPVIRNIVLISTLFSVIWTFADFQLVYVLTKGGPANSTHVFGTYAYQLMGFSDLGTAAAVSVSMFPILAVFAVVLLRYVRAED
ncbi:MAG: sugar ABC transporter permease [Chloroflexia bacterium]|nr:sugar ABC transporter permease [Chloroflexia bacterium]MDQ3513517.1 sugar ABC transporter permease [Chloroflexota bacterium]